MHLTNLIIAFSTAIFGVMLVIIMSRWLTRQYRTVGSEMILKIGKLVEDAAMSYSKRQLITTGYALLSASLLALMLYFVHFSPIYTGFAILTGATFSSFIGYLGMKKAVIANPIVSWLSDRGVHHANTASFVGGCIVGFAALSLLIFDLGLWYGIIYYTNPGLDGVALSSKIADTMITFAFGSSLVAYIARVAGGNFTKANDSAADKIGKGEYGLDEDDPRNPAVIGDNAGDAANDAGTMSNDMFESAAGSAVGSIEAGSAVANQAAFEPGMSPAEIGTSAALTVSALGFSHYSPELLIGLPIYILCIGLFSSALAAAWYLFLAPKGNSINELFASSRNMILIASGLVTLGQAIMVYFVFDQNWRLFWPVPISFLTAFLAAIVIINRHTGGDSKSVKELSESGKEGASSVILGGLYIGKISAFQATVLVASAIYVLYWVGGIYGTSLGAVAVLSILPIVLALDAQGAISDMAQGNLTMSGIDGNRLDALNMMDALGNTMAAIVKGFAIISGVLAAIVLAYAFKSSIDRALLQFGFANNIDYSLFSIEVVTGILLGAASPHLFSAKFIKSVAKTTDVLVKEIQRQIDELGILLGKNPPDYNRCVDISTREAQRNAIGPAIYAAGLPLGISVILGPAGILAYLLSTLASGFVEAMVMSNSGGAWDNAKKLYEGSSIKDKASAYYKALIDGDIVGDTTKDVAGPTQNILIKLQLTISIFTAPATIYLHYYLFSLFS